MKKNRIRQRDRPQIRTILKRIWACCGADLLMIAGAASVTCGAAAVYPPAGAIVGGLLAIMGGWLIAAGSGEGGI